MQEMAVAAHTLALCALALHALTALQHLTSRHGPAYYCLRAVLPFLIRLLSIYCCAHFSKPQRAAPILIKIQLKSLAL